MEYKDLRIEEKLVKAQPTRKIFLILWLEFNNPSGYVTKQRMLGRNANAFLVALGRRGDEYVWDKSFELLNINQIIVYKKKAEQWMLAMW